MYILHWKRTCRHACFIGLDFWPDSESEAAEMMARDPEHPSVCPQSRDRLLQNSPAIKITKLHHSPGHHLLDRCLSFDHFITFQTGDEEACRERLCPSVSRRQGSSPHPPRLCCCFSVGLYSRVLPLLRQRRLQCESLSCSPRAGCVVYAVGWAVASTCPRQNGRVWTVG